MKRYNCIIKDSRRNLEVNIKPIDSKNSKCSSHTDCVIAKAIKRQMRAKWVDVGAHVALIGRSASKAERFILSRKAKEQIRHFDKTNVFAPCKVSLIAPETIRQDLGQRVGIKARSGRHKRKYKVVNHPTR